MLPSRRCRVGRRRSRAGGVACRSYNCIPEGAGLRAGLPARWRDSWSVAPSGVTVALGLDEFGLAAAWIKRYAGPPGTGFFRIPGDEPMAMYMAAEAII